MSALSRLARRLSGTETPRSSLRRRVALTVGAVTTVVVLLFGVTSWVLVARSLRTAADDDLETVVEAIRSVGAERLADGDGVNDFDGIPDGIERPALPYVARFDADGTMVTGELPATEGSQAIARGERDQLFETLEIDRRKFRLLTVPVESEFGGGALRVGLDITNVADGLRQARVGAAAAGLLAGLSAAAIAWLLAGRLVAPVIAVAAAADHLRRNDDIPDRLEGEGDDELGRLVASFNALLDDLRRSRSQQRHLVADASHELRTPLTSLRLKAEFIQSNPELASGERQRLLDGAVADLAALGELVSELAELAAEGASPERAQLIDLAALVETTVDQFRVTSGRDVTVQTSPGMVETRARQATRALSNLLVNAHKYSTEGQSITVAQVGSRIEVRDHGPGIAGEERARVFDRFYRGPGHQSIEGSGLGLAIVESVARSNGGTTWVADTPDGGPGVVVGFSVGPGPAGDS